MDKMNCNRKKINIKKKNKVVRPVLYISDSSDDENSEYNKNNIRYYKKKNISLE